MRKATLLALVTLVGCLGGTYPRGIEKALSRGPEDFLEQAVVGPQGDGTYLVATTQTVNPAGDSITFPGRPTGLALNPDESQVAVKNMKDLVFIDVDSRTVRQTLLLKDEGNSYCGIVWSRDGRTVWTTSSTKLLCVATLAGDGQFVWENPIELPGPSGTDNSVPGGLAVDEDQGLAYVALSRNNAVGVVDLAAGRLVGQIPVGIAPYDVLRTGNVAYVSNWGGRRPLPGDLTGPTSGSQAIINEAGIASSGTVTVLDLSQRRTVAEIEVELHPSGMALAPDGSRLFVANANSDTVSVIDTGTLEVTDCWDTKPMPDLPLGSGPNALAVSPDGERLYVANGGNNCIAVLDTATGRLLGLIPVGWYPGDVRLARTGTLLLVANTKGIGSRMEITDELHERYEKYTGRPVVRRGYNTHRHVGSISIVPVPGPRRLRDYTLRAATNMRLPRMHHLLNMEDVAERTVPVPTRPGEVSVFKHVLYIIKENRTYDQVFGDLPQGNGDPDLCHFGRDATPNHHALAEEFVLLDNFYCNGVLSADGHQWTDEGYVTDYLEKSFGGFNRSYPYDGDDALAYASSGFIWDHVLRAGLAFRNYGEMVQAHIEPRNATWTDIYQDFLNGTKNIEIRASTLVRGLENYICPAFIGFPGKVQDVYRAEEFLKEFRLCEANGEWYNFIIMLLPNDHTVGTREGYPTPRATVADNDLALGRIVEAVTHSRFWSETLILVVEDDPQAGLDHVDAHRTVALCISPYTRRGFVDSTHYTQCSMLRTIELVLGLAPLTQFTMAANPMVNCFTVLPDLTPYKARPNRVPLDEMNPPLQALRGKQRYYAMKSMELPLDDIDEADEDTLNRILWHSVKGYDVPYPKLPRREARPRTAQRRLPRFLAGSADHDE